MSGTIDSMPPQTSRKQQLRLIEAIIFASPNPVSHQELTIRLPDADISSLIAELQMIYQPRGINLMQADQKYYFRTADDLADQLHVKTQISRKLSRAAIETLAIIAYHQPVTRSEIEEIRGVALSRGTLDTLLEAEWIKPRGRKQAPGRPVTWGTTESFLIHFGLETVSDLPGIEELKRAGLLDNQQGLSLQEAEQDLLSYSDDGQAAQNEMFRDDPQKE